MRKLNELSISYCQEDIKNFAIYSHVLKQNNLELLTKKLLKQKTRITFLSILTEFIFFLPVVESTLIDRRILIEHEPDISGRPIDVKIQDQNTGTEYNIAVKRTARSQLDSLVYSFIKSVNAKMENSIFIGKRLNVTLYVNEKEIDNNFRSTVFSDKNILTLVKTCELALTRIDSSKQPLTAFTFLNKEQKALARIEISRNESNEKSNAYVASTTFGTIDSTLAKNQRINQFKAAKKSITDNDTESAINIICIEINSRDTTLIDIANEYYGTEEAYESLKNWGRRHDGIFDTSENLNLTAVIILSRRNSRQLLSLYDGYALINPNSKNKNIERKLNVICNSLSLKFIYPNTYIHIEKNHVKLHHSNTN